MPNRIHGDISINSTSTGPGSPISGLCTKASFSLTGGTCSVSLEGSLDATNWTTIIVASTYAGTGVLIKSSTTNFLVSNVRARLTAHSAGAAAKVYVLGYA